MTREKIHILGMQEEYSKCGIYAKNDHDDMYIAEIENTIKWIQNSKQYKLCNQCKSDYIEIICRWNKYD